MGFYEVIDCIVMAAYLLNCSLYDFRCLILYFYYFAAINIHVFEVKQNINNIYCNNIKHTILTEFWFLVK